MAGALTGEEKPAGKVEPAPPSAVGGPEPTLLPAVVLLLGCLAASVALAGVFLPNKPPSEELLPRLVWLLEPIFSEAEGPAGNCAEGVLAKDAVPKDVPAAEPDPRESGEWELLTLVGLLVSAGAGVAGFVAVEAACVGFVLVKRLPVAMPGLRPEVRLNACPVDMPIRALLEGWLILGTVVLIETLGAGAIGRVVAVAGWADLAREVVLLGVLLALGG